MKRFKKISSWRFASLAAIGILIATLFLTSNAKSGNIGIQSAYQTMDDFSEIDRETWKTLPYQIRIPIYETFSAEKKRTFWQLKHEELKKLAWTPLELEHIDSFYSAICENPLLMERGKESEELEDWFEIFRYNWREYARDVFGWDGQLLYAISMSGEEVLNTRGELKVYTPIAVGAKFWAITRSFYDDCDACSEDGSSSYIPHPEYCAAYYICYAGIASPQWCPSGLLFNPELLVCDWPNNVRCD